ncbi:MAG: LuxR C-terminal-related transcriptional regulator [Actinomycetota bacterium]|nr:LuxR C-terminal-related transcriptional regulator [Actinomycetota bacterium]
MPAEPLVPHIPVTPFQLRVLRRVAAGLTAAEIATELDFSHSHIKKTLAQARVALGARNLAHAVALAFREGFIT